MTNEPKTTAGRDYQPLPPRHYVVGNESVWNADQMHAYYDLGRKAGAREAEIPADCVLAPRQPTLAMCKAAAAWTDAPTSVYRAMLAASPTAQAAPAAVAGPRPDVRIESALAELVDKILPGIDSGDLLADALAASERLSAMAQPPAEAQEPVAALFREALAWGMTYGPQIPAHQWDAMRETMVAQFVARTHPAQQQAVPQIAAPQDDSWVELRRLSDCCPELNERNYDQGDVEELNAWAVEVAQCIDRALAPQAVPDMDGEAFRTAARLGLTLRFHGGCAQSGMPGAPAAYEVVASSDPADAMRQAVQQAAIVIASGGEPQQLRAAAELAVPTSEQAGAQSEPKCTACGAQLREVTQEPDSYLSADQFDADKLGDWFCECCPKGPNKGSRKHRYFSNHELAAAPASGGAAPVAEGDARQVGLIAAADYIDGLASSYAQEHSYTEPDTGAVVFDRRDAGLEYHSTLVELADDLRGMAARAQAAKEGGE